jgi:hypothetical protein
MASSNVDQLLAEYVAEFHSGGVADPAAYLERLNGADRAELAALIDGFLLRQPRRAFDPAAFNDSPAETIVGAIDASLRGRAGLWPALLPRLRGEAKLKRSEVVERLASALDALAQTEKVGHYYHQMEQGLIPASGVSDRVLDALAAIVHVSAVSLRRAGEAIAPADTSSAGGAVFARAAEGGEPVRAAAAAPSGAALERDAIDRLFLGDM